MAQCFNKITGKVMPCCRAEFIILDAASTAENLSRSVNQCIMLCFPALLILSWLLTFLSFNLCNQQYKVSINQDTK